MQDLEILNSLAKENVPLINNHLPVGVDLAKYTIEAFSYSLKTKKYSTRSYTRDKFIEFIKNSPIPLTLAFEAGSSSHYWARLCQNFGHEVKLISTRFVASVNSLNKDDQKDAQLIYNSILIHGCKTCGIKSESTQLLYMMLKLRDQLIKDRVKMSNLWQACLYEIGEPLKGGIKQFIDHASFIAKDEANVRPSSKEYLENINSYALSVIKSNDCKVTEIDQYIKNIALNTHECKLLMTIPAVKEFSAFCLWLSLRDIDNYKDSTHYAAHMGYAPRHRGTGGSNYNIKAGPIGNKTIKKCYFFAAMSIYSRVKKLIENEQPENCWLHRIVKDKKGKVAICAIANKRCNVAFSMLKFNKEFDMDEFKGIYQKESHTHS